MNNEGNTTRLAGLLLVGCFFLFVLHMAVDILHGVKFPSIFSHWVYGLVVSSSGVALYLALRKYDQVLPTFIGFWFVAQGLFAILQGNIVMAGLVFAQDFSYIPTVTSPDPLSSVEIISNKIGRTSFICQGLGELTLALLVLRTEVVARWIGWLGRVAGTVALLFGLFGMAGLMNDDVSTIAFLALGPLHFGFILALGFKLISGNIAQPSSPN